jgi:hypothetical protein
VGFKQSDGHPVVLLELRRCLQLGREVIVGDLGHVVSDWERGKRMKQVSGGDSIFGVCQPRGHTRLS